MKDWYFGLEPRERLMVTAGAVVGVLLLFWGLVLSPIYGASAATAQRVDEKRATLAFLRTAAAELAGAPAMAGGPDLSGQSLVVVVDRSARAAGLGAALARNQPVGEDGIRVRLENASFDALAAWLGTLSGGSGLSIESASFERAPDDGRVNASLTLRLGQP